MKMETTVTIDIQCLREDLRNEDLGAYLEGGFGGALMEAFDIDIATPEELIRIAQDRGVDLRKYVTDERNSYGTQCKYKNSLRLNELVQIEVNL